MIVEDGNFNYPWYNSLVNSSSDLQQGDIFLKCPIIIPPSVESHVGDELEDTLQIKELNLIILTQSCDLLVRDSGKPKVDQIITCEIIFKRELVNDVIFGSNKNWDNARQGKFPRYHVLNKLDHASQPLDFSLADLLQVHTVKYEFARDFAIKNEVRHRLNPPYREHLSQAFARYFMRVGLPVDIPSFVSS